MGMEKADGLLKASVLVKAAVSTEVELLSVSPHEFSQLTLTSPA